MSTIPLDLRTDEVLLPAPSLPERVSLMQSLRLRQSSRSLSPDPLQSGVPSEGCHRHDAPTLRLMLVSAEDLRRHTGLQDFVALAPLELVCVTDFTRMRDVSDEERTFLAGVDVGCIAQNASLCCADLGLVTAVQAMVDRRALAPLLRPRRTQRITLAQTVGRPEHGEHNQQQA